jgi:outer membrane immunogenic protein
MSSIQIQTKSNGINFTSTQRLGVAALLAVASTLAIAEDKMNWAGPYAGINTGYTWVNDKDESYLAYGKCKEGCPASASNHANGSLIGADIGYNFLFQNNLLLGIETEFKSYNANKESNFFTPSSDLLFQKINSSFENKFSVLGKIGYLLNDKTLAYVKGGWANAQIKRDYTNDALPTAVVESHKSWQDGWTLGIGSEYNFYQNLTAKLEYRYADLGSKSILTSNMLNDSSTHTQNTRQNELNVGVAYHF